MRSTRKKKRAGTSTFPLPATTHTSEPFSRLAGRRPSFSQSSGLNNSSAFHPASPMHHHPSSKSNSIKGGKEICLGASASAGINRDPNGLEMGLMGGQPSSHYSAPLAGTATELSALLAPYQAPLREYTYEEVRTIAGASVDTEEQAEQQADSRSSSAKLWDCMTAEVLVILVLYTVIKTGQELVVSSIPLLTAGIFGWSHEAGGYYMAVVGAMVLPTVVLMNKLHVRDDVEERDMVLHLCYGSIASIVLLLHTAALGDYSLLQYIAGSVTLFASLNAMEGIIMALLAKVISPDLAKGTFNSALLATETGTFGRVIGDVFITAFGVASTPVMVVNQLFLPLLIMVTVCIGLVLWYFERLV